MRDPDYEKAGFEKIRPIRRHGPHRARAYRLRLPLCGGKFSYTEPRADAMAAKKLHRGIYIRVYKCPRCDNWHLTHKPPRTP